MDTQTLQERMTHLGIESLAEFTNLCMLYGMEDISHEAFAKGITGIFERHGDAQLAQDFAAYISQGGNIHTLWQDAMNVQVQIGQMEQMYAQPQQAMD